MTAKQGEFRGWSKKEKGLMSMDNSVEIAGGERGIRELKGNRKNIITKKKRRRYIMGTGI